MSYCNNIYDKNKIFNILRVQTKSNFNNKYKLLFKSSNIKKRNLIQNYFSSIKKNKKSNFDNTTTCIRKYDLKKNSYNNKNINKKLYDFINNKYIQNTKRKIITIPISSNKKKNESKRVKSIKNNSFNKNKIDNVENNDFFPFYSTKNPIFQTEINFRTKNFINKKYVIFL